VVRGEVYRDIVTARAGGACEYCRLVERACGVTFHIEHITPQHAGGETVLSNLALSCPGCNLSKSGRLHAINASGDQVPLFNPRRYEPSVLGWHIHFSLDRESGVVIGRTETGEETVQALAINSATRLYARKLQIQVGAIS